MDVSDESWAAVDGRTLRPKRPSPMLDDSGSIYFRGAGYSDVVFYKNFDGKRTLYVEYGDWVCRRVRGGFLPVMRAGARGSFPEHSKKSLKSAGKLKYSPPQ